MRMHMRYICFLFCILIISCGPHLFRDTRYALSPTSPIPVTVIIYSDTKPDWDMIYRFLNEQAALFDHRRKESPVWKLNTSGCAEIPDKVLRVIRTACVIGEKSDGAFDPTILPLLKLWNFDTGTELYGMYYSIETTLTPPDDEEITNTLAYVDYRQISISGEGTVCLPQGFGIDLGGIAKGACVDMLADFLESLGNHSFLIEAGGDILVSGLKPEQRKWKIQIQHPRDMRERAGLLSIGSEYKRLAVVTSGNYERGYEFGGKWYHHILDPHTGSPAQGVISVTVIAGTCTEADACATAAFVLGFQKGLSFLKGQEGVEGFLIRKGEQRYEGVMTEGFGRFFTNYLD
jgi:thiamine biosynthesis lipoprotein